MTIHLESARRGAEQLIAFADGYEEAVVLIVAQVTGMPSDVARGARRMRTVAYDLLRLADECEGYRLALEKTKGGTQGRLTDGLD